MFRTDIRPPYGYDPFELGILGYLKYPSFHYLMTLQGTGHFFHYPSLELVPSRYGDATIGPTKV
eukprot:761508-Hanusia_phi.AAC.8